MLAFLFYTARLVAYYTFFIINIAYNFLFMDATIYFFLFFFHTVERSALYMKSGPHASGGI